MSELNEHVRKLKSMDWEKIYEEENEGLSMVAPPWDKLKNIDQYRYKWCLKHLSKDKAIHILIIGSSSAVLEHYLIKEGYYNITSVDVDDETLKRMKDRVKDVNYVNAYIEALPFQDGVYDVSIATEVLEHLVSPDVGLREMNRVTKDNGSILITVPINNKVPNNLHRHTFDLYSLIKLFHHYL